MSGILAVCGSVVLAQIWARSGAAFRPAGVIYKTAVLALLILPIREILRLGSGPAGATTGLYGALNSQGRLVLNGYWGGWGNGRWIVSRSDSELLTFLKAQVANGQIKLADRIAHVAQAPNLKAAPFPAFTGITQDLYLPTVDSTEIHTHDGRLYDITQRLPPAGWVLIERPMLAYYSVQPSSIRFENARVVLANTDTPESRIGLPAR